LSREPGDGHPREFEHRHRNYRGAGGCRSKKNHHALRQRAGKHNSIQLQYSDQLAPRDLLSARINVLLKLANRLDQFIRTSELNRDFFQIAMPESQRSFVLLSRHSRGMSRKCVHRVSCDQSAPASLFANKAKKFAGYGPRADRQSWVFPGLPFFMPLPFFGFPLTLFLRPALGGWQAKPVGLTIVDQTGYFVKKFTNLFASSGFVCVVCVVHACKQTNVGQTRCVFRQGHGRESAPAVAPRRAN
jgi:hypothetical protein